MRKDIRKIFKNVAEFEKIIKKVYEEPYKEEKATQQLLRLRIKHSYPKYLVLFL